MTDTPPPEEESPAVEPRQPVEPIQLGEPGEHPLSVLLFSWMRSEQFGRFLLGCVAAACAALFVGDVLLARHGPPSIESLPGFMGAFGFAAFALVILSGFPLGRLLRRPETYYDPPPPETPPTIAPKRRKGGRDD